MSIITDESCFSWMPVIWEKHHTLLLSQTGSRAGSRKCRAVKAGQYPNFPYRMSSDQPQGKWKVHRTKRQSSFLYCSGKTEKCSFVFVRPDFKMTNIYIFIYI